MMSALNESVTASDYQWKKPPFILNPWMRWLLVLGLFTYVVLALGTLDVNWTRVSEGLERGKKFILSFSHPDFTSRGSAILEGIKESIIMAITSTVAGVILSVPVGLGAAKNLSIAPVYYFCRGIISVARTLNEIIVALLMVAVFGFGPFAGFIALTFASIGFLAKLLAENIENSNKSQLEAVKATGASWGQWLNYSVQPQFMPRLIGLSIYRLDSNFRHSSVVGLVGAGGIGATLNTAFDRYEFDTAAAIIIIIIAIVLILEYMSSYIRSKIQ